MFYNLLEVMKLWKLGDTTLLPVLTAHVRSTYTGFVLVSQLLGQSEIWPKLHDLLHIPSDLAWLSAADSADTGVYCCLEPVSFVLVSCHSHAVFAC